MCLIAPKSDILVLNCIRSLAYFTDLSMANLEPPTALEPIFILPELRIFKAILNPPSLSPKRFSFGTIQSEKNT